ncbi:MAG: hypothetical protein NC924_01860 [Candidatus Omnitrophica bacterium]|nr:hypothetical protein [Candidatus Omnitrophota bacterium]
MKRLMVLICSLAGLAGGVFFLLTSYQEAHRRIIEQESALRTALSAESVSNWLAENMRATRTIAGMSGLSGYLLSDSPDTAPADAILDYFQTILEAEACYLMNAEGLTVAASNRAAPVSFLGHNYAFRPYFQEAMAGKVGLYLAVGITSNQRGIYYSYPVRRAEGERPLGVVAVKFSPEPLEQKIRRRFKDGIVLLTGPHGIVFLTNFDALLYHSLWQLSPEEKAALEQTQQFGKGPWRWTGLEKRNDRCVVDPAGTQYVFFQKSVAEAPGWHVVYLQDLKRYRFPVRPDSFVARVIGGSVLIAVALNLLVFYFASKETAA